MFVFSLKGVNSNLRLMGGQLGMAWPNVAHIDLYHPYFLCVWYPKPPSAKLKALSLRFPLFLHSLPALSLPPLALLSLFLSDSKATVPRRPAWAVSARQSAPMWSRGQSKPAPAAVKGQGHYITWQRSSSQCAEIVLSGTRGATVQLSNAPLMAPAGWWCRLAMIQSAFHVWQPAFDSSIF